MKTAYQANGWIKHTEEDTWENGCLSASGNLFSGNDVFKADTVEALVKQLKAFTGCDDDQNLLLNSCDTLGRLDIQTMEDANGTVASEADIEAFKKSEKRLWLCCYTFNIELVQSAVVDLSAAKEQFPTANLD